MYDTQTQAWLDEHESELPSMRRGERIHSDPIIYLGKQPPEYLKPMQVWPDDETPLPTNANKAALSNALERRLISCGLTPLQLLVLRLRCEFTQSQIARSLNVTRQAVNDIQSKAKQRVMKKGLAFCRNSEEPNYDAVYKLG